MNARRCVPPTRRRALLRLVPAGALSVLAALPGCGFQLRRPPELQLKRIQLTGFDRYSSLADELRRQLRISPGVVLVESAAQADAVLEALSDVSEQVAATLTAAGQVREVTLRAHLRFRVRTRGGTELIGPTELSQTREMSYTESAALAKEDEAQLLFRSMHGEIALQVIRRLAALAPTPG